MSPVGICRAGASRSAKPSWRRCGANSSRRGGSNSPGSPSCTACSSMATSPAAITSPSMSCAAIFVYDNNSTDRTTILAREAGAIVRSERRQGKGHVVRRMFADVDADIYILVDGDATYDAPSAPRMIEALVNEHLDMVVGLRIDQVQQAYRLGHRTGNRLLTSFLSTVFGQAF